MKTTSNRLIHDSAHSNSPVTGSSADASIGIFSRLHKVTDMCTTLKSFSDSCPGFYVERNGNLVGTYHVQQDIVHADELTCLDDILRKKPGSINPQDGYSLAIILTASLLHLSHTPWLLSTLDKTDIAFLRLKGCTSSRLIDIKQPYLVREIFKNHSQNAHGGIQPKDAFTMAALGIVLLEIYYRLPVESMEGLGSSGVPLDHVDSIQRWVEDRENRGELTFAFAKSVKYCLQCTKEPDKKLLEPTFLADIELNVLKPLEEELHMLVHGPWGI